MITESLKLSYDWLETEWSLWLTDVFKTREEKRRSWPSQAHHLGLLAVIWMGLWVYSCLGSTTLYGHRIKCVDRVDIYIRPYWKISSPFHSRLLDSPFIVSFLTIFLASTRDWPASKVCTASSTSGLLESTWTGLFKGSRGWFYGPLAPLCSITFNGWCPC